MNDKKLLKLSEFADQPELTQYKSILDIQEDLEELESKLEESTTKICEDIYAIPESIDYSEKLDAILEKLNEEDEDEDEEIIVKLNII